MPAKHAEGTAKRSLPKKHNPLLAPDKTPEHSELVKKRRLGQTNLAVKPGQVGLNSATKPENLGIFDYAHLRAPLPESLKGSEIFAPHSHQQPPESYFLMRRSSDGYVSATGMFKAAFPWAKHIEEQNEKDYIKSLPQTAPDDIAGNVWISEHLAIELAAEYGIVSWIAALLDSAPVTQPLEEGNKIAPPPKFKFTAGDKAHLPPPNGTPRASTPKVRGRPRGASPMKGGSPTKASTKKPRATKASKEASKEANAATAREASASLQAALDDAASVADSEQANGEKAISEEASTETPKVNETVKVEVESVVETKGDTEATTTNVRIEIPAGLPDLPMPESPEEMIEKAKAMVAEAKKLEGDGGNVNAVSSSSSGSSHKRKAEVLNEDDDDDVVDDDDEDEDEVVVGGGEGGRELGGGGTVMSQPPAKRARLLEQNLKREKVRSRALIGIGVTVALGAIIPYFT